METAILVFVGEEATKEVKKRGLSIRMTELEKPPAWKIATRWLKRTIKEYDETSLLVDHEGPNQITYSHSSVLGLPDWLPKVEAEAETSMLHNLKKLQDLNDESALFFLYRIMRTRDPVEVRECIANPHTRQIADACYAGKVIKIAGNIAFNPAESSRLELSDSRASVVVDEFPDELSLQCKKLFQGVVGIVIGILNGTDDNGVPVVRCAGFFIKR